MKGKSAGKLFSRWSAVRQVVAFAAILIIVTTAVDVAAQQVDTVIVSSAEEPIGWEVLPNGMIMVQYDRSGDGMSDYVTLHQITSSGGRRWSSRISWSKRGGIIAGFL